MKIDINVSRSWIIERRIFYLLISLASTYTALCLPWFQSQYGSMFFEQSVGNIFLLIFKLILIIITASFFVRVICPSKLSSELSYTLYLPDNGSYERMAMIDSYKRRFETESIIISSKKSWSFGDKKDIIVTFPENCFVSEDSKDVNKGPTVIIVRGVKDYDKVITLIKISSIGLRLSVDAVNNIIKKQKNKKS